MTRLPRAVSYDNILWGKVYYVPIPFSSGRPLEFVVKDTDHEDLYRLAKKADGFEGEIDPATGNRVSRELKIVTEFKMRPALVIQSNEMNVDPRYDFVVVLPISTINKGHMNRPIIQDMITHNNIDRLHYIGKAVGRESYITVSDPKRLHKNMLYKFNREVSFSDEVMEVILAKLAKCLEIKRIAECDLCEKNCENCEYKNVVNR